MDKEISQQLNTQLSTDSVIFDIQVSEDSNNAIEYQCRIKPSHDYAWTDWESLSKEKWDEYKQMEVDGVNALWSYEFRAIPTVYVPPECPEKLPCAVTLGTGARFGKGVSTGTLLRMLRVIHEWQTDLKSMTPEQRAERDARIKSMQALITQREQPNNDYEYFVQEVRKLATRCQELASCYELGPHRTELFSIYNVLHNLLRPGYAEDVCNAMNPIFRGDYSCDEEE